MNSNYAIEVCLDSVESAIAAQEGGALRVELCDDLFEGGTTPSIGMVKRVRSNITIGLHVIIRPRGGDFCYSSEEFEVMKLDIEAVKAAGADGVVIGLLNPDGTIDAERTKELIALARPMSVTFHRAFDVCRDPFEALEVLKECNVDRLLTSGQEETVIEGLPTLKKLIQAAGDDIIIMPGNGITERNFALIVAELAAQEYHIYVHKTFPSTMSYVSDHVYMGGLLRQSEYSLKCTDSERVKHIVSLA